MNLKDKGRNILLTIAYYSAIFLVTESLTMNNIIADNSTVWKLMEKVGKNNMYLLKGQTPEMKFLYMYRIEVFNTYIL